MIVGLAISYILGIFTEANINLDLYFIGLIVLVSFIGFSFFKSIINKGDFKNHFVFYTILPFCFLLSFIFGAFYTKYETLNANHVSYPNSLYTVTGKVLKVSESITSINLIIYPSYVLDITNNSQTKIQDKYIKILVSPNNAVSIFDTISFQSDLQTNETGHFSDKTKLFEFSKYEDIFYNTNLTVSFPQNFHIVNSNKNFYETFLYKTFQFKKRLIDNVNINLHEPYASVANGITFGETENLTKSIKDIFKNSGLIHILVLSGTNVSFIILLLYMSLRKFNRKSRVFLTLIFAWFFIFITGLNPPALRAGIMATTAILGELFSKKSGAVLGLLISILILGLINPLSILYNTSLHLSYLASIAVFVLVPIFNKILKENEFIKIENKYYRNFVAIAFAVLISVDPYTLTLSKNIPIFSTLLTLLVEPFILSGMILTFITSLFPILPVTILNTLVIKIILTIAEIGNYLTPNFTIIISGTFIKFYYVLYFMFIYYLVKKYES